MIFVLEPEFLISPQKYASRGSFFIEKMFAPFPTEKRRATALIKRVCDKTEAYG